MDEDVIELIIEGRIASQMEDFDTAIKYYEDEIKKKEDCVVCWVEMGYCLNIHQ